MLSLSSTDFFFKINFFKKFFRLDPVSPDLGPNYRVPTSFGNHGKPVNLLKKRSMHGKTIEFEK